MHIKWQMQILKHFFKFFYRYYYNCLAYIVCDADILTHPITFYSLNPLLRSSFLYKRVTFSCKYNNRNSCTMRSRSSNIINNGQQLKRIDFLVQSAFFTRLCYNDYSEIISKPTRKTFCKQAIRVKCSIGVLLLHWKCLQDPAAVAGGFLYKNCAEKFGIYWKPSQQLYAQS